MPNKKLTDNEIVKGLECCVGDPYTCGQCSYQQIKHYDYDNDMFEIMPNGIQYDQWSCDRWLLIDLLDLINRLKEENEKLNKENENLLKRLCKKVNQESKAIEKLIKSEAYKEFAEMIDKTTWYHINKNGELVQGANSETDIPLYKAKDVHNLLKEMVGEDK